MVDRGTYIWLPFWKISFQEVTVMSKFKKVLTTLFAIPITTAVLGIGGRDVRVILTVLKGVAK